MKVATLWFDRTLHFQRLDAEDLVRDLDLHVLLDLDLAGEAATLAGLAAVDVAGLGREDRARRLP